MALLRVTRISADMKQTNILLARIADALEAQNAMLGYAAASPPPDKATNDRTDEVNEELLAAVEALEDQGVTIPPETYRKLGITTPGQRDEEVLPDDWDEDTGEVAAEEGEGVKSARRNI